MNSDLMIDKIVYITHTEDSFEIFYVFGKSCTDICSYYTLLKALDENFVRVNESTIINFEFVSKCTDKKIETITGDAFCVSPKYQKTATNTFFKIKLEKFSQNTQTIK